MNQTEPSNTDRAQLAALAAQLAAAQRDNTRLIERIVALEHALRDAMAYAALVPRGVDPASMAVWRVALGIPLAPPDAPALVPMARVAEGRCAPRDKEALDG